MLNETHLELNLLGSHDLGDLVIRVHGSHPLAQTFAGGRSVLDLLRNKLRVGDVFGSEK